MSVLHHPGLVHEDPDCHRHHRDPCCQVVEKTVAALARAGYDYSKGDALRSDGESTQTLSKTRFGMFWLFHWYKRRSEADGFVVASEKNCKKRYKVNDTSKQVLEHD